MDLTAVLGYNLTYTAGMGGTISGTSLQMAVPGAPGTAIPDSRYHFVQWSDGVAQNPRTDTQATADMNVTAQYEPKKSGNGGGGCFIEALER